MQRLKETYEDTLDTWSDFWDSVNERTADSWVGQFFKLRQRKSKLTTELRAGLVTFLTTAYILSVNALILSDTGGPCSPNDCTGPLKGQDACVYTDITGYTDPGYAVCLEEVKRELITATAASSLLASCLMGLLANLPVAAAPGMGLNAYFAYNVVGQRGRGRVSYETALGAVFIEGWIFVFLAVTSLRLRLIRLVPKSIMLATSAGIGLYLAFIGLQNVEGLGVVSFDSTTLVTLGGCPQQHQAHMFVIPESDRNDICSLEPNGTVVAGNLPQASTSYACLGHKMESASVWLGIAGLVSIAVLMSRSFRGSVFVGIFLTTIVAWIPGHAASYLGSGSPIPGGQARLDYFKQVVSVPRMSRIGLTLSFRGFTDGDLWIALITFLYVDFLDTTGTMFSMASFLNNFVPGFVQPDKTFERHILAFSVDGLASVVGSLFGTSPVTAFIESASGIREGGRTGLTALTVAFFFFVALFFTPILATIPPYAVGPALITVGALMMMNAVRIKWDQAGEALPAFATMIIMPLTYSIAYGVIAGIVGYIIVNSINWTLDRAADLLDYSLHGKEQAIPNNMRTAPSFSGDPRGNRRWPGSDGSSVGHRRTTHSFTPRAPRKTSETSQSPRGPGGDLRRSLTGANAVNAADPGPWGPTSPRPGNKRGTFGARHDSDTELMPPVQAGKGDKGSRRSSLTGDFNRVSVITRSESEPDLTKLTAVASQMDHSAMDPRNSQGLQAAASRLQQLFEEAQLPNGTSIWPPEAPDDGTSSPDVMGPASRNTSRDSLWGLDESRASDSIMGSGARNLPRMSPWNWSPRTSMQRQPDADALHPHEEADEEENESSAGVALRNRLVGFINRISSRMSMMSGGSEGPDNAGSSMGATSRQPDMHLPASVPEAEMETRPSMATTSAFSDHPSEAAPSTPRSQAMHRASPIAIQPPGKRTSIFRAFGVKRGQARAEGAGQDAQGGPQQEAAAAKLAPEEKPSELLPAELTGWPPTPTSGRSATPGTPAQRGSAHLQGVEDALPPELTGWPPRQRSISLPKARSAEMTPQARQMVKINSSGGSRPSISTLRQSPGGNGGSASPSSVATPSGVPPRHPGSINATFRGPQALASGTSPGDTPPTEVLPEELVGWPPRRPSQVSTHTSQAGAAASSGSPGSAPTAASSPLADAPSGLSDPPETQFEFDKSSHQQPQRGSTVSERQPEGCVAIAMPEPDKAGIDQQTRDLWDDGEAVEPAEYVPADHEQAGASAEGGGGTHRGTRESSETALPPRSMVQWLSQKARRSSGNGVEPRGMIGWRR